jgi:hypothetical protein
MTFRIAPSNTNNGGRLRPSLYHFTTMANTNKWDEAVMRLHRRYIAAGKMKRATRLILRAKLQLKFALVRKLQQQSDALVAAMNVAPRCVVCRCNNIAFDGPVCNEHAS